MAKGRAWADWEDDIVRAIPRRAPPGTLARVAGELGRTYTAIGVRHSRLTKRGPPRRRFWTPQEEAKLIALRAGGLRWGEVAKRLGRSYSAVYDHAWKRGMCRTVADARAEWHVRRALDDGDY